MKTRYSTLLHLLVLTALICQVGIVSAQTQPPQTAPDAFHPYSSETSTKAAAPEIPNGFTQPGALPLDYQYVRTFGETGVPYNTDNNHLYDLNAVIVDPGYISGNLDHVYALESMGQRILAYQSTGELLWTYGNPGSNTTELNNPNAGSVDPNGNLWITSWERINIFDASGNYLFRLPEDPWSLPWDDPLRFDCLQGMDLYFPAASQAGLLAVSLSCGRNEFRIYNVDISSTPYTISHITTISGMFQSPAQLAWNGPTEIFVNDNGGPPAVYRCNLGLDEVWTCSLFDGGEWGQGEHQLQSAQGLVLDGAGHLFIADSYNRRIKRCDIATGSCDANFIGDPYGSDILNNPSDIAILSNGNLLVSDRFDFTIRVFDSSGTPVGDPNLFAGTPGEGYIVDNYHYNQPTGVYVDANFNTYIVETAGNRIVKLDPAGNPLWTFGVSGVPGWDNNHLNWPEGSPAVDGLGRVYVPDRNNQRVVILKPDGTYLGQIRGNNSEDPDWLDAPQGVAFDENGDIYVLDNNRGVIKVFDPSRFYKYTIGLETTSWPPPQDNEHFRNPRAMALDGLTTLYVADTENNRVQKCTRPDASSETWACKRFAGHAYQGGSWPVERPTGLAVDSNHNVLVADENYNHVFIYSAEGYLINRLGGNYGPGDHEFKNPANIALDSQGGLVIADRNNHRIQKFVPIIETIETVSMTGGSSSAIKMLNNTTALIGKGSALQVVDLSTNPPVEIALTRPTSDLINDIDVIGNTAYVLSEYNSIYIYDITDPANPVFHTIFNLPGSDIASDIDVHNGFAYIADGGGGLGVYDLADPLYPVQVGQYWTHQGIYSIAPLELGGDTLILGLARDYPENQPPDSWVVALNVTDPTNIFEIGSLNTPGSGEWLSLSGTTLVVADGDDASNAHRGLQVVDVTDPTAMTITGAVENFYSFKVETSGNYAFSIDGDTLFVVDISDPANPSLVNNLSQSQYDLSNLAVSGDQILATDNCAGLRIFDFSSPPDLTEAIGLDTGLNNALWVELMDHYAVLSGWDGGLRIMDVADPQHPVPVSTMPTSQSVINSLTVAGNYAYLANFDTGMTIVDLSDPASPAEVGYFDTDYNDTTYLDVAGDYAYLADGDALRIVDISNPETPTLVSEYYPTAGRRPWMVKIAPSTDPDITTPIAYVIEQEGSEPVGPVLRMIDISDIENPVPIGASIPLYDGYPVGLQIHGENIFIAYNDNYARLEIINAADLDNPYTVSNLNSPNNQSFRNVTLQELDNKLYAYIASRQSTYVADLSDLYNPSIVAEITHSGWARNIAVNGPFVYTTYVNSGLLTSWFAPVTMQTAGNDGGGFVTAFDGINYAFSAGVLPEDTYFIHTPVFDGNIPDTPDGLNLVPLHLAFDIIARDAVTDQFVEPQGAYTLVIPYDRLNLEGINPQNLKLFWWDVQSSTWVEEPVTIDAIAKTITAMPNHFSTWQVMAELMNYVFLPALMR